MSTQLVPVDPLLRQAEEDFIDTLIAWKRDADKFSVATAAARHVITQAKELKIWTLQGKYKNFKEWLEQECGITERWAYGLLSSAKLIADVEAAARDSKRLSPLVKNKKKLEALRALPDRAIAKLRTLSTEQAAKAALKAIENSEEAVPTAQEVAVEVEKFTPAARKKTDNPDNQPVLIAFDNEVVAIEKDLGVFELKPKAIIKRLRSAVEKAL